MSREIQRGLCKTQAKKLTPSESLVTFFYVSYEKFSVTEFGLLRVYSYPELTQWNKLWFIIQSQFKHHLQKSCSHPESDLNRCISYWLSQHLCVWFCHNAVIPYCDHYLTCLSPPWLGFLKWRTINISFDLLFLAHSIILGPLLLLMKFCWENKWTNKCLSMMFNSTTLEQQTLVNNPLPPAPKCYTMFLFKSYFHIAYMLNYLPSSVEYHLSLTLRVNTLLVVFAINFLWHLLMFQLGHGCV